MTSVTGLFPTFEARHTNEVPKVRGGVDNTLSSANAGKLSKMAAIDNPMTFFISFLPSFRIIAA